MELEDQEAQEPLLVTAAGRSGDGCHLAASGAASSSSIAVVVASTAVAVAGSFEFGISVIKPSSVVSATACFKFPAFVE